MKFAHMADCHIGSWREPLMRSMGIRAFETATERCIRENVDFVLIAGDLFNTSIPQMDALKSAVFCLKRLRDSSISVYIVPGSHDYSPSGKSMLEVLESAGLLTNVAHATVVNDGLRLCFTKDRSGAKITGMPGKRGGLEKHYYADLDRESLEKEEGFRIFMLHSALTELKGEGHMDSAPISLLPRGFDYYAAGHVHERQVCAPAGYGPVVYPGPLFPNTFRELEELGHGGFYIVNTAPEFIPVKLFETRPVQVTLSNAQEAKDKILDALEGSLKNTVVTLRLLGLLSAGRVTDIPWKEIFSEIYGRGALFVMKNTRALLARELEEASVEERSQDELEKALVKEHLGRSDLPCEREEKIALELLSAFSQTKTEGETNTDFAERIVSDADRIIEGLD